MVASEVGDIFPDVEGVANTDIVFSMPDSVDFGVYTSPIFKVTKEEQEGGCYNVLNQSESGNSPSLSLVLQFAEISNA